MLHIIPVCFAFALSLPQQAPVHFAVLLQDQPAEVAVLKSTDVDELKKLEGKSAKVTGKVAEVYKAPGGSIVVLNFGKDIKKCFKVAIKKESFGSWEGGADGIDKLYADKTLTVVGQIVIYKDTPEIVGTNSKEITVASE